MNLFLWAIKRISGEAQQIRYSKHKILHLRTFIFGHNLKNVTFYGLRSTRNCKYLFVWWRFCHQETFWAKWMRFRRSQSVCLWFICPSIWLHTWSDIFLLGVSTDILYGFLSFPLIFSAPALSSPMFAVHIVKSLNMQFSLVSFCFHTLPSTLLVNVPNMWSSLCTKD